MKISETEWRTGRTVLGFDELFFEPHSHKIFLALETFDVVELELRYDQPLASIEHRSMRQSGHTNTKRLNKNPLKDRTPEELKDDVRRFHNRHKLEDVVDVDLLIKGALIAQDDLDIETFELSKPQKLAIKEEEKLGLFQQTKGVKATILATACAAIIQGWQQSSINASSRGWQCELVPYTDTFFKNITIARAAQDIVHTLTEAPVPPVPDSRHLTTHGTYIVSLIDAAPWISASIIGTWLSDPLQEYQYGRRRALFLSAIVCAACVVGTAHCHSWQTMLVCRLLLGIGIGAKASIAPVFAAEAAPEHLRGRLLTMWQLFDTFGIFIGFVCYWVFERSWRGILGSAAVPALMLLAVVYLCPESPRFLIRKRDYAQAFVCLRQLRGTAIQAAKDLYYIHSQLQMETEIFHGKPPEKWWLGTPYQDEVKAQSFIQRVKSLFTVQRNRRACMAAFLVMIAQQLCGINVLSFYSSEVFQSAQSLGQARPGQLRCNGAQPERNDQVAWLNFGFGLANFLFTIPAYRFIDWRGRRVLLLTSLGGMFFTLCAISGFFRIDKDGPREVLVATFSIVVFTFFYGIGAGPVPFTFSAEVFPLAFREVGMSFSVMVNFLGLSILILFVPRLTSVLAHGNEDDRFGHSNLLFAFTILNAVAFVLVFFLVPSGTAQISLEEMNHIFNVKTREHAFNHLPDFVKQRCHPPGRDQQYQDYGEETGIPFRPIDRTATV